MIRFVVALYSEAKPLVAHYKLSLVPGPFRIYRNEQAAVVVSGIGKAAAAAATSYLHTKLGEPKGGDMAQHRHRRPPRRPVGEVVVAHKIVDQRHWKAMEDRVTRRITPARDGGDGRPGGRRF